jgi:hypothetical protein
MRIIFLDVDGVLNTHEYLERPERRWYGPYWWSDQIDPILVKTLNTILKKFDAKIVVISTWRYYMPIDDFVKVIKSSGFQGEIIDYTPCYDNRNRGEEIQSWLDNTDHQIKSFAILDDVDDMGNLSRFLIKIDADHGLTEKYVDAVKGLLEI